MTRQTMIERVARAICLSRGGLDPDQKRIGGGQIWESFVPQARATIGAMREPTGEMLRSFSLGYERIMVTAYWQEMIDAALTEGQAGS